MASQMNSVSIVCSAVWSSADQTRHQSSMWLFFIRVIHRWFPSSVGNRGRILCVSCNNLHKINNKARKYCCLSIWVFPIYYPPVRNLLQVVDLTVRSTYTCKSNIQYCRDKRNILLMTAPCLCCLNRVGDWSDCICCRMILELDKQPIMMRSSQGGH